MSESTELKDAVQDLMRSIDGLRQELVRKDVYAADKLLVSNQFANTDRAVAELARDVEKAEEKRQADRRLLLGSLILPVILILFQVYLAAQTGGTP